MIRFEDILERVARTHPVADRDLLRKAYVFSAMAHRGQVRRSGEPYLTHPLEVAHILADLDLDEQTVATGLLHDAVEDAAVTIDDVEQEFGPAVAQLVDGVTKLSRLDIASEADRQAETVRKMILAMVRDIRVIFVKLADRLHNMRTLMHVPPEKQVEKSRETLEIYIPIAHRLGIGRIRAELEDLVLRYLEPESYRVLEGHLKEKARPSLSLIEEVREKLAATLGENGLECDISGRIKSVFSIHRKMQRQQIDIDQVYDIVAFRIITSSVKDCYGALGIVHGAWHPVPGRIKDYIAMPKPNLYQSLHTTLMSERGYPFEVQIRTEEMDKIAEEGIAAHWRYKEQGRGDDKDVAGVQWLRSVMDWQHDVRDPKEFLKYVKVDLYPSEVYVFTPKGRVVNLPRGSCPIDFAYSIHTEVGHQCAGARVNGRLVPLKTELDSGDIVEIVTQKGHHPSRDWLGYVKTSRARTKVRSFLKQVERERSIAIGRNLLEREMRRVSLSAKDVGEEKRDAALRELKLESLEDLHAALGLGTITPQQYLSEIAPDKNLEEEAPVSLMNRVQNALKKGRDKVLVHGVGDTLVSLARCCNPIPGDAIVGYITRGRGVTVHTEECPNLEALLVDPRRQIEVEWARERQDSRFMVGVRVTAVNRPGMLAKVALILEENRVNIRHADAGVGDDERGIITVVAEVEGRAQVERLLERLRRADGVFHVARISPDQAAGHHAR